MIRELSWIQTTRQKTARRTTLLFSREGFADPAILPQPSTGEVRVNRPHYLLVGVADYLLNQFVYQKLLRRVESRKNHHAC